MRLRHASIALLALLQGCAVEVRDLAWGFTFDDESLSARAAIVEGRLLSGGCAGAPLYEADVARGEVPSMPPSLPAGRYGFEGVARDAACVEYARGCLEVDLPRPVGAEVLVRLSATAERAACTACSAGRCDGAADAGLDARTVGDASPDASLDARDGSIDAVDVGIDAVDASIDVGSDVGNTDAPPRLLPVGDRIDIDFGPTPAMGWVMHGALAGTTGPLTSAGGVATDVSVTTRAFSGEQTGGSTVNELGLPLEVCTDTLWVGDFAGHDAALLLDAQVELTNLGAGHYSVVLFASRLGDDMGAGRLTRYRIGDTSVDYDPQDNTSRLATFADVVPDPSGTLTVHVGASPSGTSRFGYVGSLTITRLP